MADQRFSRKDIEGLAKKLDGIASSLSPQERTLLIAIFAAAAARAEPSGQNAVKLPATEFRPQTAVPEGGPQADMADLMQQLLNAYIPGSDFASVIPTSGQTGKVTEPNKAGSGGNKT